MLKRLIIIIRTVNNNSIRATYNLSDRQTIRPSPPSRFSRSSRLNPHPFWAMPPPKPACAGNLRGGRVLDYVGGRQILESKR